MGFRKAYLTPRMGIKSWHRIDWNVWERMNEQQRDNFIFVMKQQMLDQGFDLYREKPWRVLDFAYWFGWKLV
jgi:hypothetical protein